MIRLFALVICVGLAAVAALAQPKAAPKRYAVLVGVNVYEHEKIKALSYAENDAFEMDKELRKHGYETVLLTDAAGQLDAKRAPTKANIERELKAVLAKCKKGDTVVLGFAGHGMQFEGQKDAFFLPADARPFANRTDSMVSLKMVYDELDASFAGMKVVFVDACRDDPKLTVETRGVTADSAPKPPQGVACLFSCSAGEQALEHRNLKHGVFFHYVLEGLRGKAKDSDGDVTFAGLASYVTKRVAKDVPDLFGAGRTQHPNLKADYSAEPVLASGEQTAQPVETIEEFEWKGEKRKRTVRTLPLGDTTMEFVKVSKGSFLIGAPDSDPIALPEEKPRHRVTFTSDVWVGKYPVTKGQFASFVSAASFKTECERDGKGGKGFDGTRIVGDAKYTWRQPGWTQTDRHPVVNVSWNDANAFCRWAAGEVVIPIRLLSEAEYEYANRGGEATLYPTGDEVASLNGYVNIADITGNQRMPGFNSSNAAPFDDKEPFTSPVGSYKPNGFGLYDTTGNVWCWCSDWFDKGAYQRGNVTNPKPHTGGDHVYRIVRGGAWLTYPRSCRASYRFFNIPVASGNSIGFRVCFTAE